MAGLLGAVLAGGAKGYADQRIKSIEQQEAFDMKQALMDAEMDKQLRLKEAGIKMEQDAAAKDRAEVGGLLASAKDPNADKGGYESEEMKVASKRAELERGVEALRKAGRLDEAKSLSADIAAMDKSELSAQQLELRMKQIENAYSIGKEKLEMQGKMNEANVALKGAQAEAALARAGAAADKQGKMSDADKDYQSYVDEVKSRGKGEKPMSRYRFENWRQSKLSSFKNANDTTVTEELDPDGELVSRKVTKKTKDSASKPAAKTQPVKKYVPGKGFV